MYVPAILTGCGTSIMFVTTLALAADFVNADRVSWKAKYILAEDEHFYSIM